MGVFDDFSINLGQKMVKFGVSLAKIRGLKLLSNCVTNLNLPPLKMTALPHPF
jgi:hypothetical protein